MAALMLMVKRMLDEELVYCTSDENRNGGSFDADGTRALYRELRSFLILNPSRREEG